MSESIVVRPLEARDYAAWLALWQGYNAFYGREGATALPDEVTQTTWRRFFDAYEPMFALVAASVRSSWGCRGFIGIPTKPTRPPCGCMTRWRSAPVS